jgi:metal-dependent HD superfamily phosphatase/phosphodiesterase
VEIRLGESRPIKIEITLNNAAGVFQLDSLLREKLKGSGLERYVEIDATVNGDTEKRLINELRLTV